MRKQWLVIAAVAMSLTACSGSSETAKTTTAEVTEATTTVAPTTTEEVTTPAQPVETDYEITADNAKLLGRTYTKNHITWMSLSASGAEFKVKGKAASIMLFGDSTATAGMEEVEDKNPGGNRARFAIYIDDELLMDDIMVRAAQTYPLFEGEEEVEKVVRVVKLSEAANSSIGIRSVTVTDGTIEPVPQKEHLIEFIGDSITCGYGVDDEDRNHHFSTSTEDATKAYAYRTAQLLDADYSLVSYSGYGVISGYSGNGQQQEKQVVSRYYDKVGYSYGKAGGFNVSDWEWEFARKADVVVINLGTNDNSYVRKDAEKTEVFTSAYVDLIKQVREKNPEAQIVCALGMMGDELYKAIEDAVGRYTTETEDTKVEAFHLENIQADEGYGADWHPTAATHKRNAELLAEHVKEFLK